MRMVFKILFFTIPYKAVHFETSLIMKPIVMQEDPVRMRASGTLLLVFMVTCLINYFNNLLLFTAQHRENRYAYHQ